MKRTALKRRTPLRSRGQLARKPRRLAKPTDQPEYLARVRQLPCCARSLGPCHGRIHAHHATYARRGLAMRALDRYAAPYCGYHHRCLHDLTGPFYGWDKARRREWEAAMVAKTVLDARFGRYSEEE